MKNACKTKKGSVMALCLVFATVLLVMGLAYAKMTSTSKVQTVQVDERIKLEYLANGITEMALLKFQLYPADFYACMEAANSDKHNDSFLKKFTIEAPEFTIRGDKNSHSSFNDSGLNLQLASMTILTNQKWRDEVLYIEALAAYEDIYKKSIDKRVTRIVELERHSLKP